MKRNAVAAIFVVAVVIACFSCTQAPEASKQPTVVSNDSLISRGRYLVTIIGCGDCHSPKIFGPTGPQEDTSLRLSGYPSAMPTAPVDADMLKDWVLFNGMQTATAGPWGISFSANITSDSTGIGNWTEQQFMTALRKGKSKGLENNRMLLPPMPWQDYAQMHDEDLKAIFAYLKSTKPVRNVVPAPVPPTAFQKKG